MHAVRLLESQFLKERSVAVRVICPDPGGASVAAGRHPLIQRILVGSVTARGRVTADDDSWLEAQSSDSDFDEDSE
jgi:hypothetical protein